MNKNKKYRPWLSIWFSPAFTVRAINNDNPRQWLGTLSTLLGVLLVFPYGLQHLEHLAAQGQRIDELFASFGLLFLSALIGFIALTLLTMLATSTGRLMGGRARAIHIRTPIAWSFVAMLPLVAIYLIDLVTPGYFCTNIDTCVWSVAGVFGLWAFILATMGMKEVQHFRSSAAFKSFICILFTLAIGIAIDHCIHAVIRDVEQELSYRNDLPWDETFREELI